MSAKLTRVKKLISFFKKNIFCLLILFLAAILRFNNYYYFPVGGETADEVAWAMIGSSLIQEGKPSSWSYFGAYEKYGMIEEKENYRLVSPALDHPPLFALIPGFFHSLKYQWSQQPSIKLIRFPLVIIGTLNVALFYFLAKKIFDKKIFINLATLIYATVPTFVFASRLVMAENLLATFVILTLYFLADSKITKKISVILILLSIFSILTKVAGFIVPISIITTGLIAKDQKITKSGFLGLILGSISFAVYGAIYNWRLFVEIFTSQAGRELGLATLQNRFFLHPAVVDKLFFDGWLIVSLLAMISFFLITKNLRKYLAIKVFLIINLLFILASAGEQTFHGWYDITLYPIFSLVIAWLFNEIIAKKQYLLFFLVWLFLLPAIRLGLDYSGLYVGLSSLTLRLIMILGGIPMVLNLFKQSKPFAKKSLILLLSLLFIANIFAIFNLTQERYWELDYYFNYR